MAAEQKAAEEAAEAAKAAERAVVQPNGRMKGSGERASRASRRSEPPFGEKSARDDAKATREAD